ncbi:MAG: hypothetical protein N2446_00740 [Elusimicrobiales bacterium]|nr:hypothetical protein [Elusimicrobiales bacterium]
MKTIIDLTKTFFSKPEEFVKNLNFKTTIYIFLTHSFVKITYNLISSHPFPPEMNFEFSGIVNPKITDFILSYFISEFLYLGIFLSIVTILISEKFLNKILISIFFISFSIYSIFKSSKIILTLYLIILILATLVLIKKNIKNYLISLKILISIHIISIISTFLIYFSEIISSNILFMVILFLYSILSFGYFVKLFIANYDITVKKLIIYSLIAIIVAISYGISITKLDIFNPNTEKLILYN